MDCNILEYLTKLVYLNKITSIVNNVNLTLFKIGGKMSKVAKATIVLMIATMLSKILGFGREVVLGSIYGTSIYSDIYITSMNIPTILFSAIGTALGITFIPIYYENQKLGGEQKAVRFANNVHNIVLLISTILALFGFIFAKPLVKLFAIGFEGEILSTTIRFTRIMIFNGIFISLSNLMTVLLQIKNNFTIPGLIGIPFNIIIIISILFSSKISINILPIGTLCAVMSQFLFQYYFVYKNGYRHNHILDFKDEYIKKIIWLVAPVFIGVAVNQVNAMIDRTLASTLVEGSISALNYANKLNGFVMGLFITTLGAVIYPTLSKLSFDNDKKKFTQSIINSLNTVIILVIPISVGSIILSKPIVKVLFQRGAFDETATYMTSIALIFYSIGMVAFGLRDILGKIFYSLQDTKTPMINGTISVVLNIILNLILFKFMGYAGLALATSLSAIICIFLLFNSLKQKVGYFGQNKIVNTAIKSIIASIIMGIFTKFTYNKIAFILGTGFINEIITLFSTIGIGLLVYILCIIILKIEESKILIKSIKSI